VSFRLVNFLENSDETVDSGSEQADTESEDDQEENQFESSADDVSFNPPQNPLFEMISQDSVVAVRPHSQSLEVAIFYSTLHQMGWFALQIQLNLVGTATARVLTLSKGSTMNILNQTEGPFIGSQLTQQRSSFLLNASYTLGLIWCNMVDNISFRFRTMKI
jgi:hypothetical protein